MIDKRRYLSLLEYELALQDAEADLIRFAEITMPDPKRMDDVTVSKYQAAAHHRFMADIMMQVEMGLKNKVIMNTMPRAGKTEICTKRFCAWYSGRHPDHDIIVATYNEKFAHDFSKEVREIMSSPRFQQVFPDHYLVQQSDERLRTNEGGDIFFLGRRSSTTGRGGNIIIVDDPTKDDKEIRYPAFREDCWQWFTQTLLTRRHNDRAPIILTQCMTGETPVLMADGSETQLRDVKVGDHVATYDNGILKSSKVTKCSGFGPDYVLKIRTKSGAAVRANARHPFLVKRKDGGVEWRRTGLLKKGDAILRVITANGRASLAASMDAKSQQNAADSATRITARTSGPEAIGRHLSTLSRAALHIFDAAMELTFPTMTGWPQSKAAFAPFASIHQIQDERLTIGGRNSAWTTVTKLERSGAFSATNAISSFGERTPLTFFRPQRTISDFTPDEIVSIEADGIEEVFDITVERTENFIANGLVSHNTRWHEDDIVGRISDPSNPSYSEKFAQGFEIISLPAIAEDDDPLGRNPGEPLWPERFGLRYLEEMREANAGSFASLYQCDPTPEEGSYYRAEELHEYTPDQLPERLQIYVVSDHAVATKDINDPTCIVPFGICENGKAWILPSVVWRRLDGMQTVEEMLGVIRNLKPMFWYAEKGHISKALKPFLMKRMEEEGVYCPIIEEQPIGDKLQRATSARARCAQGMIMFPKSAPWWHRAKMEMLKFPNGRFDDFVDCLSMIGIKLAGYSGPGRVKAVHRFGKGTYGELLQQFKRQQFESDAEKARKGW
jgi:predicted phage terminase large subunit-like protein